MRPAVAVAASGGRDSTALLHSTARAAAALGVDVHALHVHHGLVPAADQWLAQLRAQCRRWGVAFHAERLATRPARGDSVEAWARRERYRALAALAQAAGCSVVLLAHHRRDQAETLLLQALRGGGPAGLAAMPAAAERAGLTWARPWLEMPREAIEAYVRRHRLRYADDTSNDDERFARNRLRRRVWPALVAAFPDAETQLHAAALRAREAAACLSELAAADVAAAVEGDALCVQRWQALSAPRRTLALRRWLRDASGPAVPESLVQRLARELPAARSARWPAPGGELRLHDGRLRCETPAATPRAGVSRLERGLELGLGLDRPGRHALPDWGGVLVVEPTLSGGIDAARLRRASLRPRQGGEQFQRTPRGVPRSLKKQYQALRVPAWQRGGPLLFDGEALLFAPGLGIDARCVAAAGAPQCTLRWEPLPAA